MLSESKIAIIGAGKMGETLIGSLLEAKAVSKDDMVATAKHEERVAIISKKYGVRSTTDNRDAVKSADVVILCVKPQAVREVLDEIKNTVAVKQLLISIAASVSTAYWEKHLGKNVPVVRTMPNTPCLIRKGMTAICPGQYASDDHLRRAEDIFKQLGKTIILDEKYMDAATGLSASGPAFIYIVIESMAEGGVKVGLPRAIATELAAQAVFGGASMVLETREHPALLKDGVTTPAGCTIDGIMELEEGGLRVTLIKSVVKATQRASELIENN
ncbi:pyrroline-5-carboxylate reductase [candidate division KSB1 bacterium]|nr:pyrroline-5-carboxylate reductase [candidate division KSB1 bacterium]NIR72179.1 pyrroline-5-carboxylate reductase [candidate division KSB1 bacterium]NIS26644.1 pyrroline-5-carboxylate reductase [candidate division KSB1 bacterium]NIT73412.1 pyrroline-5-carboxylate reductase [candidate division KSB1 bacterium]NIU27260.1 pyrroline-5-carboxylate reductase [candidate division KSB1 bacterium]